MTNLYTWLLFIHLLSVGAFLFVHGITGGVSFLLRGPVTGATRGLLRLSQISGQASQPAILLILITGIWMVFAGSWATKVWPWLSLGVLIAAFGAMIFFARPYYMARDASKANADDEVAKKLAITRPDAAAGVGVIALVILFFLMVFKPF